MMLSRLVPVILLAACSSSPTARTTPANTSSTVPSDAPRTTPRVAVVTPAEWEACQTCDDQILEGDNAPLEFENFPAVTLDGRLVAVVEERDGWAHVPIPGVRLVGRDGKTVTWLPITDRKDAAEASVRTVNAELAKYTWSPIEQVTPKDLTASDELRETQVVFGRFTATYSRRFDGATWLPPSRLRVVDDAGRVVVERTDTERAWSAPPACNLPAFELVGVNAAVGVMLFKTGLGMGSHDCDGVEQRPTWHVLPVP